MDCTPSPRRASVHEDWRCWLAGTKNEAFQACRTDLESSYVMLSVALNEAFEFIHSGLFEKARQAICIAPGLCRRLGASLTALLHEMGEHTKHHGTVPNAVPLDAANFRGAREQRAARMNSLLSNVLLTRRAQFLYKLSVLDEMVHDLQQEFCSKVEELACEPVETPLELCNSLDSLHFDLNTCLQETIVLLKSFFVVLPAERVQAFENSFRSLRRREFAASAKPGYSSLRTGRTAQVAGE
jgi:hypothetical protein